MKWTEFVPPWRELVGMIVGAILLIILFSILTAGGQTSPVSLKPDPDNVFSAVGIARILVSAAIGTVIAALIGYGVWALQTRSTRKRVEEATVKAARLARDLEIANEEKNRIAEGHVELMGRMSTTEKLLASVREQLLLLDQQAQPLLEAAKKRLVASLTHPSAEFRVPDELLKQTLGPKGFISPKLKKLLKERETSDHPDVTPEEKLAAAILPQIVALAKIEADSIEPLTATLQVVMTPPVAPETETTKQVVKTPEPPEKLEA